MLKHGQGINDNEMMTIKLQLARLLTMLNGLQYLNIIKVLKLTT